MRIHKHLHYDHRPWPLPAKPWVMTQTWHDLLFAHWPVPAEMLRPHIPPDIQLDTYARQAWVGVVPFRMSGVRPRGVPPVPALSAFPELNVRTYVTDGEHPGVWFFSLDAGNPIAVTVARRWFHLPYFRAQMLQLGEDYLSQRTHGGAPPADLLVRYRPTDEVFHSQPGTLEYWLTERYCLYTTDRRKRLLRGDIHHNPWPLQPAEAEFIRNTMTQPHDIVLPDTAPLLHFARRLDVLVWPLALAAQATPV
jgi:hypothetical protein